jgi:hypothetical protein
MFGRLILTCATVVTLSLAGIARAPATHRLEATPQTVAYGYQLTSIAGNVAITQLVDAKVGVHLKMPKAIFQR